MSYLNGDLLNYIVVSQVVYGAWYMGCVLLVRNVAVRL